MTAHGARAWSAKLLLLGGSALFCLLLAEIATRILYPISDGSQNLTLDGQRISDFLTPGSVYRQISTEYDALTTITDKGHRVPGAKGNPEIVFLGDSFTFGWGLNDEESFASIYCRTVGRQCANLGTPATGTAQQLDTLQRFLDTWGWRPRQVKLFVVAMTSSFSAGNDLSDNVRWSRRATSSPNEEPPAPDPQPGLLERLLAHRLTLQKHSNLARVAKYLWGPLLKSLLVPELDEQRLAEALALTRAELQRLDEMSERYGFDYDIYLIHPVQDVLRGTHEDTLRELNRISPVSIQSTAHLLRPNPKSFYFYYDGHINSRGSRRIADLLISQDRPPTPGSDR